MSGDYLPASFFRTDSPLGVAEWCYEAIAERLEGSFRSSQNHIVIQQRPPLLPHTDHDRK